MHRDLDRRRCAVDGSITMEQDGGGRASVTFANGDTIVTRWRP